MNIKARNVQGVTEAEVTQSQFAKMCEYQIAANRDFACGSQEFIRQWHAEREATALSQADSQPSPTSMYVMGILSDIQQLIEMGQLHLAVEACNTAKIIIDKRMAVKDEHGRHDYSNSERFRKGMPQIVATRLVCKNSLVQTQNEEE